MMTNEELVGLAEAIADVLAAHVGDQGDTYAVMAHRNGVGEVQVHVRGYDASVNTFHIAMAS